MDIDKHKLTFAKFALQDGDWDPRTHPFIAKDSDDVWWAYTEKPYRSGGGDVLEGGYNTDGRAQLLNSKEGVIPWKQSVISIDEVHKAAQAQPSSASPSKKKTGVTDYGLDFPEKINNIAIEDGYFFADMFKRAQRFGEKDPPLIEAMKIARDATIHLTLNPDEVTLDIAKHLEKLAAEARTILDRFEKKGGTGKKG